MSGLKPSRGFPGAVLKLLGAGDYTPTVTRRQLLSPHYLRLSFDAGGLLADRAMHPTRWIRIWFAEGDKLHQLGYTRVGPDPEAGTVAIEFALHHGVAANWAKNAKPGDTVDVTVLGSNFDLPEPRPNGYIIVSDTASLPAINSLLGAIGDAPSWVFPEAAHDGDKDLPVAGRVADVEWMDRKNNGEALVQAISSPAFDATDHYGWVACDNRTTRAVAKVLREDYGIPRKSIKAQAYWVA